MAQRLPFDGGLHPQTGADVMISSAVALGVAAAQADAAWFRQGHLLLLLSELVTALTAMIADRRCLEVAAGYGTLSCFLAEGVDITATHDHGWDHRIAFPREVVRQDTRTAVWAPRPQVVICSWLPAGNSFERHVYMTRSVELYIVIGSRHEHAAGDRATYRRQTGLDPTTEPCLSERVLPPELEPAASPAPAPDRQKQSRADPGRDGPRREVRGV